MNSLVKLHSAFTIISSNFFGEKRLTILFSFRKGISHWVNQNKMGIWLYCAWISKSLNVLCVKQSTPETEAFKKEKIFIYMSVFHLWWVLMASQLIFRSAYDFCFFTTPPHTHPHPHSPQCIPVLSRHLSSFLPYTICLIILALARPNLKIRKIWLGSNKIYLSFCVRVCLLSYHRTLSYALATEELHGF